MNRKTIISHKMEVFQTTCTKSFGGLFATLLGLCFISTAHAQIFVANQGNNTIGEYTTSGATVNASLINDPAQPDNIAVSGTSLFEANSGSYIGEYTTSGATVNASLINDQQFGPGFMAISGPNLFIANTLGNGTIGEYTTSGATVNASLITLPGAPELGGIALFGSDLFVTYDYGFYATIGEYTTSGATVNASLITGLNGAVGIAISGSDLFVANNGNGTIGEYTTSGATVNGSLISDPNGPFALAISGSDLFVANYNNGTIGEYTTSGATVNASLVTGLNAPTDLAVIAVPEPSALGLMAVGLIGLVPLLRRRGQV